MGGCGAWVCAWPRRSWFRSASALAAVPDAKPFRAIPKVLISYFSEDRQFDTTNTEGLLGPCTLDWKAVLPNLLAYAAAKGFLHASSRTAPEQVLFRLQSTTRPVRFHEIAAGTVRTRTAPEVRGEMLRAAASLRRRWVLHGATAWRSSGSNSVRYLVLDVAAGSRGGRERAAVRHHARRRDGGDPAGQPVTVSFHRGTRADSLAGRMTGRGCPSSPSAATALPRQTRGAPHVLGRFPGPMGNADEALPDTELARAAPLRPGDHCASPPGTTGRPKGAIFRHDQVRWMAETLASLLPWKARVHPASYLSFLPMNHVVEGILGTYAPYYLPAPVDIWFLDDFRALSRTLPRVRPTVFFSVPRFYEKVWESFCRRAGWGGSTSVCAADRGSSPVPSCARRCCGGPGLDRCAQLISGSAPASAVLSSPPSRSWESPSTTPTG